MEYTARELSEILNCQLEGDPEVRIRGISEIQSAGEGDLTFLTNPKYRKFLKRTRASAIISGEKLDVNITQLICREPYVAFARVLRIFYPEKLPPPGISDRAVVSESARIGRDVYIGENAFIGDNTVIDDEVKVFPNVYIGENCFIGKGTVIFPNVTVCRGVRIGEFVRIHSGAVIGSDGFGYAYSRESGKVEKVPQVGSVRIGDFVEIGSNATVDRGTIGDTVIGSGTKIDNLVQIGHNVKIGENCFIVSQVGISGSTNIGSNVTLAGQVGVAGHIEIADNVTVAAKSGIAGSIRKPGTYGGIPAVPVEEWRKEVVILRKLPEIYRAIRKLLRR